MHIKEQKLKEILTTSGIVDEKSFDSAKVEALRLNQSITDILIAREEITEDYLIELLEPYVDIPRKSLSGMTIPKEALNLIPKLYAKTNGVVIFEYDKEKKIAKAAMIDPLEFNVIEYLRAKLDCWVEQYITTPSDIKNALKQYDKVNIGTEFNDIITENVKKLLTLSSEKDLEKLAADIPIVTILDAIIEHAIEMNASDIHFEPFETKLLVRYRIDGILHEIANLHELIIPILVARVKILANLHIDEHRVPQDGRFQYELEEVNKLAIRVNIMPVMYGEKVEMRLLKNSNRPLALSDLGLSKESIKYVMDGVQRPHGMILVTGPTGHGKTTTLYAILHILNTPKVNITTIEDPIEYEVPRINQTQVNIKAGITFANGLRSLLRQNPDVIMVGEIRDRETVDISIQAALTGHLVLSSLHTNDAPSALPRLVDMGAQPFLIVSTVNLIIAQRLLRRICRSCIVSYKISPEVQKIIQKQINFTNPDHKQAIPETLFKGQGCKVCNGSGFQGQLGIFEIFKMSDEIRNLILQSINATVIRKQAIKEGMITMFEDGLQKVEQGITTIEELLRVVNE